MSCSICLSSLDRLQTILPCGHPLHSDCFNDMTGGAARKRRKIISELRGASSQLDLISLDTACGDRKTIRDLVRDYLSKCAIHSSGQTDFTTPFQQDILSDGLKALDLLNTHRVTEIDIRENIGEIYAMRGVIKQVIRAERQLLANSEACPICRVPFFVYKDYMFEFEGLQESSDRISSGLFLELWQRNRILVSDSSKDQAEPLQLAYFEHKLEMCLSFLLKIQEAENCVSYLELAYLQKFNSFLIEFVFVQVAQYMKKEEFSRMQKAVVSVFRLYSQVYERINKADSQPGSIRGRYASHKRLLDDMLSKFELFVMQQVMGEDTSLDKPFDLESCLYSFFETIIFNKERSRFVKLSALVEYTQEAFGEFGQALKCRESNHFLYRMFEGYQHASKIGLEMKKLSLFEQKGRSDVESLICMYKVCMLLTQYNELLQVQPINKILTPMYKKLEASAESFLQSKADDTIYFDYKGLFAMFTSLFLPQMKPHTSYVASLYVQCDPPTLPVSKKRKCT